MPFDWAAFGVDLHLDLDSAGGRRLALERALRAAIRDGRLAHGQRLPSTRALAAELSIARGTVNAAYDQLVAEGFLAARTGSGTVVAGVVHDGGPAKRPAAPPAPPRYDLRPGSPDVAAFPVAEWLRAARRGLNRTRAAEYDYGDPRGHLALRVALAEYLGRARGVLATPERIVITSGYVQALSLLAGVLSGVSAGDRPAPAVAMEDPGIAFHREVVRRAGGRVVPLPVDDRGARADRLDGVRAVVVTPAHQYPIGAVLHPARRHALVDWARAHDGLIIEDDYDGEFRYDRQPVGAVQGMEPDRVAYAGTVAKTLAPALRLGWVVLPDRLVEPVAEAKQHADYQAELVGQLALTDMITTHGYDRHVRACRLRYRHRRDDLVRRLAPLAGPGRLALDGVAAGLHALVRLPAGGPTEGDVLAEAERRGLALGALGAHWHDEPDHASRPGGIIVGYGTPADGAYPGAVDALVRTLRTVLA